VKILKMDFRKYNSIFLILAFLLAALSCKSKNNFDRAKNVELDSNYIKLAERFKVEKNTGSVTLTILNPWQGAKDVNLIYHLVREGSPIPSGLDSSEVIFVPLKKIICMSTTHIAMVTALDEESSIAGVSGAGFIYSKSLLKRAADGDLADVGYEGNLNNELILQIKPDLVMMYGVGSESAGYVGKLKELGIKVMFNADYLENDPLGKAEWIKVFGALYCKESIADSIFKSEAESYDSIRSYIADMKKSKPKVMLGLPYKDTWYISPGNSFVSKFISDAGGDYIWNDTESNVSMPFAIENVYLKALDADFWLNTGAAKTKNDIKNADIRLEDLPCFKNGNLFNNNKRLTDGGGNDYWESGSVHPHIILRDIASILHPDLFPDYSQIYYRKIE
jgi:iron complex transport system substrate-binding protein